MYEESHRRHSKMNTERMTVEALEVELIMV